MNRKRGVAGIWILAAVLIVLTAAGVFYYNKVYKPSLEQATAQSTSYNVNGQGPQKTGKRTLIAENDGVSVYKDGDYAIIVHGDTEAEFADWNENFGSTNTRVYLQDFDQNGRADIILLDEETPAGSDETQPLYGLYVLTPSESGGKDPYTVHYTNAENWLAYFNGIVTCYLSRPQAYPNLLQFVMDYSTTNVQFDAQTGLALPEFRAYYTNAPRAQDGNYADVDSIRLDPAMISYDEDENVAHAQIPVYALYKNADEQQIGNITVGIELRNDTLSIRAKSVVYAPLEELAAAAPQR